MSSEHPHPLTVSIIPASNAEFIWRLDELIDIHLKAMNYPDSTREQRHSLWLHDSSYPDFTCAIALEHRHNVPPRVADDRQRCVGVAFAFRGGPKTWWYRQVAMGLAGQGLSPTEVSRVLYCYSELSEVHVHPDYHHRGIGRALLSNLLPRIPQDTVMLSTPEVPGDNNPAWRLYRSFGFTDLLRGFYFHPDPRPFGILQLRREGKEAGGVTQER